MMAPYGSWKSPIEARDVARDAGRLGEPRLDGESVFWTERRPLEGGRTVVVELGDDGPHDRTPAPFNVRSRVHEYGGGAHLAVDGTLYFSHFVDQRLYRQERGASAVAITAEAPASFADLELDAKRGRLIAIRELSSKGKPQSGMSRTVEPHAEPKASVVAIDVRESGSTPQVLVEGAAFYSNPRISPRGDHLCWLSWDHPNMPWDGTRLWLADLDPESRLLDARVVAGSDDESIFQPEWSPDGSLYFISDRSGFWNPYRLSQHELVSSSPSKTPFSQQLISKQADFGLPQWLFGMRTYALASKETMVCAYCELGIWRIGRLDLGNVEKIGEPGRAELEPLGNGFTYIDGVVADEKRVVFLGAAPDRPTSLLQVDLSTGRTQLLRPGGADPDPRYLSEGTPIEFATRGGTTAYAFFYPPKNDDYEATKGELPPLITKSHGGPTAAADNGYNLAIQYWTSRGFAVVDVNYGGSTGFGRAYRRRLSGQWGIVDVDDCVAAARFLAEEKKVDPDRMAIRGGSAGGYTTLAALAFRDIFRAGASHYGIGDLEALARDTHKFESRYLDGLIGPYSEDRDLYRQRSPLHSADQLSCPVIFFQGLDDKIVPPNQAETMVRALREKEVPVAYVEFEGEGHGFRRAESIARALDAELYFYSRIFGFVAAEGTHGPIEQVAIENLATAILSGSLSDKSQLADNPTPTTQPREPNLGNEGEPV